MLCLSTIVKEDVLRLIQVGMSLQIGSRLAILEKRADGWYEIEPLVQPNMSKFCRKCRERWPEFRKRCWCSDMDGAENAYSRGWEKPGDYQCHMGLRETTALITAVGTPVATFTSGQTAFEADLKNIRSKLRAFWYECVGCIDGQAEQEMADMLSGLRIVTEEGFSELRDGLEKQAKLISELASTRFRLDTMIHEMNATALLSIRGGAERLARHARANYQDDRLVQTIASDIDGAVRHLVHVQEHDSMAANLLRGTFGRPNTRPQLLNWVVQECLELYGGEAARRLIDLHVDHQISYLRKIPFNYEMVRVALGNIIGNAVKYSHSGNDNQRRMVQISLLPVQHRRSGFQTLTITNWGMGVLEDDKERIFWPYTRGSNYDQPRFIVGTGLGLYVAKSIIERHGGTIDVWCELFDKPHIDPRDKEWEHKAWETIFTVSLPEVEV